MLVKPHEKYFLMIVTIIGVGFILATLFAGLYPNANNWGVNQIGFLPVFLQFLTILLMCSFCIPSIQIKVLGFLDVIESKIEKYSITIRRALFLIFLVFAGCLFWLFREELPLSGDGSWLIRQVPLIDDVSQIRINFTNQPFVGLIIWNLFKFLSSLNLPSSATLTYQLLSIVSGVGVILFFSILARDLFEVTVERYLFLFFVLFSGGFQIFFGNIENYAFTYFVLIMFIVYGVKYLENKGSLIYVSVLFGILFSSSFGAIVFSPALAWLYFKGFRQREIRAILISIFLTIGLSCLLLWASGYTWKTFIAVFEFSPFHHLSLTDIKTEWHGYTLLSWKHFLELGNFVLKISPFALPIILLVILMRFRKISWMNETWIFFLILALCGSYMFFIFSPALGMSRDWITLVSYPTAIIIASAYGVLKFLETPMVRRKIILLSAGITFISSISWITLNNNEDYSLARFKVLPEGAYWGPNSKFSIYEQLAILYRNRMDGENAVLYYRKCLEVDSTRGRIWMGLAHVYSLMGDTAREVECYQQAVENRTKFLDPYINLSKYYASRGQFSEAVNVMQTGLDLNPDSPQANNILGEYVLLESKTCEKALPYFLHAIRLNSQYAKAYFNASMCYSNLNEVELAKTYLTKYFQYERNTQNLEGIQELLIDSSNIYGLYLDFLRRELKKH